MALMRLKSNVTDAIVSEWVNNFKVKYDKLFPVYFTVSDIGQSFIHKDREFTIVGITDMETFIVSEKFNGSLFYWEMTTEFVRYKMDRRNIKFKKKKGKLHPEPLGFDEAKFDLDYSL